MSAHTLSVELFAPRTSTGVDELLASHGRLAAYAALGPSCIGVSGPACSGTFAVLEKVRRAHGIRSQIHLPRADLTEDGAAALVDGALRAGAADVLVLGGVPGSIKQASGGGFGSAAELVGWLKRRYGSKVSVAVCGYPRGTRGEAGDYAADLAQTAKQTAAGAESVLCLPCFDVAAQTAYEADARSAGVPAEVTIAPGVLPLCVPAEFRRICRALHLTPPDSVDRALAQAGSSEAALRQASRENLGELLRGLHEHGAGPPHIYTLNSATLLTDLDAAGYRPLKHRQ